MSKKIDVEYDDESDEYILFLDGESQGPVDKDSLQELSSDLYMHFSMFKH